MTRGRTTLVAVLATFVALASACTSNNPSDTGAEPAPAVDTGPHNGGRLVLAVATPPGDLNPAHATWTPAALQVARGIYDQLAVYDETYRVQPQLASAITPNADFTEWTITLRPNVVFSDGQPLDAEAVKANLDAQRLSPSAGALMRPIKSVFVTGPTTVHVLMRAPWSTFADILTGQPGFVASPATLTDTTGAQAPVGTGPFTVASRREDGGLTLTKNSSYWQDGLPRLDAIEVDVISDPEARSTAVQRGQADVVQMDEPRQLADLRKRTDDPPLQILLDSEGEAPKLTVVLNAAKAPFIDLGARQAVGSATNRVAMGDAGYGGLVTWVRGPVSDTSLWYNDAPVLPHDVGAARNAAKTYTEQFGAPLTFTLLVPDDPVSLRYAAIWQRQLREAGIDVALVVQPEATVAQAASIGDFDAAMLPLFGSWHPDNEYPAVHLSEMTPLGSPGPNLARFGSVAIDEALDKARATSNLAEQVDAYRAAQNGLVGGGAYLFLVRLPQAVVARADVRDLTRWTTASDQPGLPMGGGTVSLVQVWLDRPERPSE